MIMVLAVIVIVVTVFMPMITPRRQAGYDAAAQVTGRNAQNSMEIFGQIGRTYPRNLEALLEFQPNLASHPEITFRFGRCNSWGYTFTTQHHLSEKTFTFQADYSRN
jgi:type II secretory pathway pseudopilin PulG